MPSLTFTHRALTHASRFLTSHPHRYMSCTATPLFTKRAFLNCSLLYFPINICKREPTSLYPLQPAHSLTTTSRVWPQVVTCVCVCVSAAAPPSRAMLSLHSFNVIEILDFNLFISRIHTLSHTPPPPPPSIAQKPTNRTPPVMVKSQKWQIRARHMAKNNTKFIKTVKPNTGRSTADMPR